MIPALLLLAAAAQSGAELLQQVAETYAHCKSYRDHGVVVREWLGSGREHSRRYLFNTAFVRPDRLRFEFGEKSRDHDRGEEVVWSAGGETKNWSRSPSVPSDWTHGLGPALEMHVAETAWGSVTVPPLLLELSSTFGVPMVPLTRLPIRAEPTHESLDGRDVWRLELEEPSQPAGAVTRLQIWIDPATHLLLQVEREQRSGSEPYRARIRYEPELDVALSAAELAFSPPWDERRPGTFGWLFRLATVGGVLLGITWYLVGKRSLERGQPIIVRTSWYVSAGLLFASIHPLSQVFESLGGLESLEDWRMHDTLMVLFAVALPLLSLFFHFRKHGGYTVVGANETVLSRALVAALHARGLETTAKLHSVRIRGASGEFVLGGSAKAAVSTIKMKDAVDEPILQELLPSLAVCFGSDLVPFDRAACRRRMIYGFVLALVSFFAAVWIWGQAVDL